MEIRRFEQPGRWTVELLPPSGYDHGKQRIAGVP